MFGRRYSVEDFHLIPGQRLADGAHDGIVGWRNAGGAAGFRHAVTLQHGEAEGLELASDGRVEAGASGDEIAHALAQHVVHAAEEDLAEVYAEPARKRGDGHHGAKQGTYDRALLLHFFLDAIENEIEELRHAGEDGDVAFLQGAKQFAGVHRLEVDDTHADGQRQHDVGHLGEGVEEREDAEDGVFGADVDDLEHTFGFGLEVAVREHHTLGIAGGARSVEDHRDVVRLDRDGPIVCEAGGKDVV